MNEFTRRLQQAFDNGSMAEVSRRLAIPHATVRNYFQGRMPAPDVLIKIANETNVSLNWLLIGTGEMYTGSGPKLDIGAIIEMKIQQIIDRKFGERQMQTVQDFGEADSPPEFDIESILREHDDPQRAMLAWFAHEGREYPQDYGVVFFRGWETFTADEKLDAVKDAKKVLDRTLKRNQH